MTGENFQKLKADVHKLYEKHRRLQATISAKHLNTPLIRYEIETEFHRGCVNALGRVIQLIEDAGQVDMDDYPQGRSQAV